MTGTDIIINPNDIINEVSSIVDNAIEIINNHEQFEDLICKLSKIIDPIPHDLYNYLRLRLIDLTYKITYEIIKLSDSLAFDIYIKYCPYGSYAQLYDDDPLIVLASKIHKTGEIITKILYHGVDNLDGELVSACIISCTTNPNIEIFKILLLS